MELTVKSIYSMFESSERGSLNSYVRQIIGDDYDLMPMEILDEEDLGFLSPTNFQESVMA